MAGLLFLLSAALPKLGVAQLVRAEVGYVLGTVAAVCLFVTCRRYLYTALVIGPVLVAASFALPNPALAYASHAFALGWGWLGLLWASWRLGGFLGVVVAVLLQYAFSAIPIPPPTFANLLPDWALRILG
ncbi:MAG: hypothetical protein ACP5I3_11440, partial [Thermoproteus sp.]